MTLNSSIADLDERALDEVLAAARATGGIGLRELADHLQAHPDALLTGSTDGPKVLLRLLGLLAVAGYPVVLPCCTSCGKQTANLPRIASNGRVCQACGAKSYFGDCARCGRTNTRIAARRPEGRICYSCYRTDRIEPCARCGRDQHAVARLDNGGAICSRCWTPPQQPCAGCGRVGRVVFVSDDGPLCVNCYRRHHRPRALCGRCNRVRIVSRRGKNGAPDLCESCNPATRATATCSQCGRDRPGHRDDHGEWICKNCTPRIPRTCARCLRSRPVNALLPLGPVCSTCYCALHDHPAPCAGCREVRVLIGHDDRGSICGPCAGSDLDPRCRTCYRPGRHHTGDKCARCVLTDRVDELLTSPDGTLNTQLAPVRELLLAAEHPNGQIAWLARSGSARLLRELASREEAVTHDYLDTLPQTRAEMFLRQLLVEAGVLPARNDDLERIPPWLDTLLVDQPDHHVRLIQPFAHWFVLRRARRIAARRRYQAQAGHHIRMKIRVALEFLTWLDTLQLDLAATDQAAVDRWLAEGTTRFREVRYFLAWARSHRLVKDLRVPTQARSQPAEMLDEQDRWRLLERSLHDTTAPLDTRAAAALILLYGLPLIRVRSLTTDHLEQQDDGPAYLIVGAHRLLLPPKLAQMLSDLAEAGRGRSRYSPSPGARRWLFTGLVPGRPLSAEGLGAKLAGFGLHARPARNAALIALAAQLPPAVLADLIGLHHVTATRWSQLAARDWHAFVAARPGHTAGTE
ncbi:hypothetical protein [Pseudonocardia acidicola]|uniref:Site-specific recombinase XerD n=1 Tax=Pseudonocardia acidicola TaxID=2724939 RepID=A0ABX1S5M7_9PSEU|nr:hypothetical protein [Pseudonocardia acidicola]NMH95877.1 hypothetical protein [Pseudonocardia acidicola]